MLARDNQIWLSGEQIYMQILGKQIYMQILGEQIYMQICHERRNTSLIS
jgi:hypothetical protein